MALTSVRSNKMRSLLTMLGIIIGIAAVIAIETVGNSMTGSVMDSMSGMGASNISVTVTQKSSSDTSGTSQGVQLRRFMDSKPSDADLITDALINDFTAAFPTQVHHIELTQQVGSGTTAKYGDPTTTITATVSGINHAALAARNDDSQILYGRWLDDDRDAGRKVACVSEKFVEQAIGGSAQDAIGKAVTLTINQNLYTFYIQGVYKYTEDSYSSMFGGSDDDSIQTDFYIPLDVVKAIAGAGAGYQSITVVANGGTVNVTDFVNTVGDFFASYYTRNDSWTVSASSLASLLDSMTSMMSTVSLGISAIAALSLLPENARPYQDRIALAIDHHPSQEFFAAETCLDAGRAACGELMYDILRQLGPVTADIALPLYVAVSTDCGCFVYGNTSADTHRVAAALMDTGIPAADLNKRHFRTKSFRRLRLESLLTDSMEFHDGGEIAIAAISLEMLARLQATEADAEDIAAFVGQV